MKIDSQELREVAATQAPRFDIYVLIHKALRALMTDTLLAVGRMDPQDALERAQVTQRVVELADLCASHLDHENSFVHPAIEARAPGASSAIAHEHEEHGAAIASLRASVEAVRAAAPDRVDALALALYRELALFVGHNFAHMNIEETAHNAALWSRYTDAEIVAVHDALLASIPPEEMMFTLRWMVPFMNPAERAAVLSEMRAHAPRPAFDAALATVQPHLSEQEWAKLARALDLPPVPGLVGW